MKKYQRPTFILWITLFLLVAYSAYAEGPKITPTPTVDLWMDFKGPVHDDPRIIGKIFSFRGRASYSNGNLTSLKIWMAGTKRILGVLTDSCIPNNLAAVLKKDLGAQVYGVFSVYTFTPAKAGVMQYVCIDSVKITRVIKGK